MSADQKLLDTIVEAMQEKKARDIVVVHLVAIPESICRHFVICTGGSPLQTQAIAQEVGEQLRECLAESPVAVEGMRLGEWVALDYTDVIVHIMLPDARAFYDIEHLWADAPMDRIPNLD